MAYVKIERENWQRFFDGLAHRVPAGKADVRVEGLDIGDQLEVDQLPLLGIAYDARSGSVEIEFEGLDHSVGDLGEIWADERDGRLHALCMTHPNGHLEVLDFEPAKAITAGAKPTEARPS